MIYAVSYSTKIKKDLKLAKKRRLDMNEFKKVVDILSKGEELPEKYEDHALKGNWKNHRECHIRPDWLLIYQIRENILVLELTRTGTHADLFGK